MVQTTAIFGMVELKNGLVLNWLSFEPTEEEAVRVVTARHVHVVRCWVTLILLRDDRDALKFADSDNIYN